MLGWVSKLGTEIEDIKQQVLVAETRYQHLLQHHSVSKKKLDRLNDERLVLQQTVELFRFVIENKSQESREKLEKLLTFGLRTVFKDQVLSVDLDEAMERNKHSLKINLVHNGTQKPLFGSFGGGVVNVAGNVLRILTVVSMQMKRFLVLDEQFSMVSENYVPNVAELMRKLCDKMNMDILMITHKEAFKEYANKIYHVDLDKNGILRVKDLEIRKSA